MNIAIVDDCSDDRAKLWADIKTVTQEKSLALYAQTFDCGESFLEESQIAALDAVFLDIYMNKINGMEVAQKIYKQNPSCQIVFVTTTPSFAVQSYQVKAAYYLLKPYTTTDIAAVLSRLDRNMQKSSRFICVKEARELRRIFLDDILYADYSNHYAQIHTIDSVVSTYIKFSDIEDRLLVYPEFLSCYRCIVINMNKIKKAENLFFLLANGEYIPINRKRAKEIKAQYTDYIFGIIEEEMLDD